MEEKKQGEDDDEDEWEDASDGEEEEAVEEGSGSEHDSRGDEKKDTGKEKAAKSQDSSPTSPAPRSRSTSAGSPKEQRTPRPKVHIPPPATAQESPEGGKPISPFSPLDGHQPVSDWGEEMEMLSPRSSMGGESPLKPPSTENSPPQKKAQEQQQEEETVSQAGSSSDAPEPQRGEETGRIVVPHCVCEKENAAFFLCLFSFLSGLMSFSSPPVEAETQQSPVASEPEPAPTDAPVTPPSNTSLSDSSGPAPSEVTEAAATMDEETPAAPTQGE